MANQGAPNNQPRPARDTHVSGGKMLTGARCSLSQMPPTRFTAHQALIKILADDSEYIGASDYRNGSDFESEIVRIRVTIATVGLNQVPPSRRRHSLTVTRANLAEAKFMAVVMALEGSLKVKWGVVPRPM